MTTLFQIFWRWYNQHLFFNTAMASFLFILQLVHLWWLTFNVVAGRLTGTSYFELTGIWEFFIVMVDYAEIPAILTTSLVYINDIRRGRTGHGFLYLTFINLQWLHLFWITDEFVLDYLGVVGIGIPGLLAWIALSIDYLEIPVIFDTLRRLPKLLSAR